MRKKQGAHSVRARQEHKMDIRGVCADISTPTRECVCAHIAALHLRRESEYDMVKRK
jgi:hypothetical protein